MYRCRIFDVLEGEVTLPDGRTVRQSWIEHRPSVTVVPVDAAGDLVLINQYRHAGGGMLIELPAGTMDREGESAQECAQRELAEETGFRAGRILPLFAGFLVPGYCREYMHFFLALDLSPEARPADPDEYIRVMRAPLRRAREMIRAGQIRDVKTALGIELAYAFLQEANPAPLSSGTSSFPVRYPRP